MRTFWASHKYFWQIHLTVALCTAVATGVLAGALIVGDSVRGSLRALTLERLGTIQHALIADRFFQPELIMKSNAFHSKLPQGMVPAILLNGTVVVPKTETRASKVNIYGVDDAFFQFWQRAGSPANRGIQHEQTPPTTLNKTSNQPFAAIVINEALQSELNVQGGDAILVNFPQAVDIHPEFLLGRRETSEVIQSLRLIVRDIIGNENAGRFSLRAHQSLPLNVFIALPVLQKALGQAGKVNALFTADVVPLSPDNLQLTLAALGLNIQEHENHFDLQSQQYLLKPVLSDTALTIAAENHIPVLPTLTYLANTIRTNDKTVPYATIMALPIDKLEAPPVSGGTDEIILNTWAAAELDAKVGDSVEINYYRVDAGETYTIEKAQFLMKGIVPIEGIAADRDIIPEFPGIHDTADMSEWESPFPIDYTLIRSQDEAYWDEYGATPKAYVPLETGKRLWKNRFGELTAIRLETAPGTDIPATRALFETEFLKKIQPEQVGFQFLPLRSDGLEASAGATDFGMLFSSLSFFLILAVAWLVEMFFCIGVEQRSREIGILQAVGYPLAKIRRRFLYEGGIIAGIGSLLGCLLAIGYAQLMIFGLQTWWLPAIGTPFIEFHASLWSLLIGILVVFGVVMISILRAVVRVGRVSTAALLAGETDFDAANATPLRVFTPAKRGIIPLPQNANVSGGWVAKIRIFVSGFMLGILGGGLLFTEGWSGFSTILLVVGFSLFLLIRGDFHQFVSFVIGFVVGVITAYFPVGAWILDTLVTWFMHPIVQFLLSTLFILGVGWSAFNKWLSSQRVPKRLSRMRFALKNAAWQAKRSKACVTTVSLACCIIVAVGANRHDALPETAYAFVAESALPLHHSLNTPEGRFELGFSEKASQLLSASEVIPFRVLPGEDVSCLNLYRPQKPQILGVSDAVFALGGSGRAGTWRKPIPNPSDTGGQVIAIGDEKSLRWILHHNPDDEFIIQDEFGKPLSLHLRTLENSLFQSQLIISEENFMKYFPSQSGYQFFLIKTPPELMAETEQTLEKTLGDYGFDVTLASVRLASYRAVENTYISTFQSLGGLGVLLGTLGLALVLFRNIIERRRELAALRAFGFRRQFLSRMLFLENCFLLTVGMLIGIVAGLAAILTSQWYLRAFPWLSLTIILEHLRALPWLSLTITLLSIFVFGIIANAVAAALALRSPLLSTLKSE